MFSKFSKLPNLSKRKQRMLGSMRQQKLLPLRQEGVPIGGGSVSLPQSRSLHRLIPKGRFLHFIYLLIRSNYPNQYKNAK